MITDNLIKLPRPQGNASAYRRHTANLDFEATMAAKVETAKNIHRLRQELADAMWRQELLSERFQQHVENTPLNDLES